MATRETQLITQTADDNGHYSKRESAQRISFAQIQEILQRNVSKNSTKTYTQYTRDLLRTYILNASTNQESLREISRFLCRNSMLYQKLLMYYASMPLFYYNVTQINDFTKTINANKSKKDYQTVLSQFETFNLKKEGYAALYVALRDGLYVGFMYDSLEQGKFLMPLDSRYCRIYGKTPEGEWIVYFDASYFDASGNDIYIKGVNGDGVGVWHESFIAGYEAYQQDKQNARWFRLPPELTFCLTTCSEDEFYAPTPFFLGLFDLILSNLDLEALMNSRTELENYILLVSKIPLLSGSPDVDDFAISLELAKAMQAMIDEATPDLVGTAYSPFEDIKKITFERSNTSSDVDELAKSINNIFNNAGASQLVVAGGSSTNAIGLKHGIQNDIATDWVFVQKMESWLNYYIKMNISEGYRLQIHKITWYNQEEYQSAMKDAATLGGSALDYLTSLGDSPYMAIQKLNFENTIGIKDLMIPLQSSYTQSSTSSKGGREESNIDDLSPEGIATREGDKNGNENV